MKKYFSFLLVFSLAFVLVMSILAFTKKSEAAYTNCTGPGGDPYDRETGTSCAVVAVPCSPGGVTSASCASSNTSAPTKSFTDFVADRLKPISYGDAGWDVALFQAFLYEKGFLSVVTGNSLSLTKAGTILFQKSEGLRRDGIAGLKTLERAIRIIKKDPKLADNLIKKAGKAPVKKPVKKDPAPGTPGTPGTPASPVPQCEAPQPGTKSTRITAVTSTDNWQLFYAFNSTTNKLRYISSDLVQPPLNTYVLDTAMPWQSAETFSFELGLDEQLVWVLPNDALVENAGVGHFILPNGKVSVTRASFFEEMETDMLKPVMLNGLATENNADMIREIIQGTWKPIPESSELGLNGIGPWGFISGISPAAMWLQTVGVQTQNNHISIWKTKFKGDGAFPPCTCPVGWTGTMPNCVPPTPPTTPTPPNTPPTTPTPPVDPVCPTGTTGTYPNCVTPGGACPTGWLGTPPNCIPPPSPFSLTGSCRGVAWPALEYIVNVKFNQPVAITGTPQIQVQGVTNGVKMSFTTLSADKLTATFRYVAPATGLLDPNNYQQIDYIGNGKLKFAPLPSGASIKRLSDGVNAVLTGEWPIPAETLKCVGSSNEVLTVSGACRGVAWPALDSTITVKFNKVVTVFGGVKVKILGATNGVEFPYLSGSGTDTLNFRYVKPGTGLLDPHNYQYADYVGNGKFGFMPLPTGAYVKGPNGVNVNLVGEWNIPAGMSQCLGRAPIAVSDMCLNFRTDPQGNPTGGNSWYRVTYSEPVVVTGAPILQIKKSATAPTVTAAFVGYDNTEHTALKFSAPIGSTPNTGISSENYEGVGTIVGGSIKAVTGGANASLNVGTFAFSDACTASTSSTTVLSGSANYRPSLEANEPGGNNRANYFITFSGPVNIPSASPAPAFKIKKANGEYGTTAVYKDSSGNTLRFHASDDPQTSGLDWLTDYEGTGEFINGSSIKDATGASVNSTVPASVVFDNVNI